MIGIDPRPFSLRKLEWMVAGKCRQDYDVTIATIVYLNELFNGTFRPERANPYRDVAEFNRIKSPEHRKELQDVGLKLLRKSLKLMSKKRPRKKIHKKE